MLALELVKKEEAIVTLQQKLSKEVGVARLQDMLLES